MCQEIRMERLRSSRGYSDEKMYAVFANQPSEETFTAASDLVIENGGTFEETEKQIDWHWEEAKNRREETR